MLRGDPAHKIVNPVLYRYEEVRACWQQVTRAGAVGRGRRIRHAEAPGPGRRRSIAERRAAFRDLRTSPCRTPATCCTTTSREAVARLIEEFLAR